MYPWIRASKVGALALAGPRLKLTDTTRIRLRVWPGDLDAMLHMNNGRYLSLMDLGRLDLGLRAGLLPLLRRRGWTPLLAAATTRFWRPLAPFARFELTTRLAWWDRKWLYLQHEIWREEALAAQGLAKMVVKGPEGTVAPAELLAAIGLDSAPPPPPEGLEHWESWEETLKNGGAAPKGEA